MEFAYNLQLSEFVEPVIESILEDIHTSAELIVCLIRARIVSEHPT